MHKFSSILAEDLYQGTLESWQDSELGDAETFGWFALFLDDQAILSVDSQGFVSVFTYGTMADTEKAWEELEEQHEAFEMLHYLTERLSLECDGLFLLVDTLKRIGSTVDLDALLDHVKDCADCDVNGNRQQVLDY